MPIFIPPNPFLLKARKYCDFQERSHAEVRTRLREWKVNRKEAEEIIVSLINDGYLNEERFARAFARGKFRIKKWGRIKISMALKAKGVSDYCIRAGMEEIDSKEYLKVILLIAEKKLGKLRTKKNVSPIALNETAQYIMSRGFEPALVWKVLKAEPKED